jgi:hypothetical protein
MTRRWAEWAGEEVASWPEDISAAPPSLHTLSEITGRVGENEGRS